MNKGDYSLEAYERHKKRCREYQAIYRKLNDDHQKRREYRRKRYRNNKEARERQKAQSLAFYYKHKEDEDKRSDTL